MKDFIKKTLFISLPLLVLLFFMEFLLRNIPNDYSYKKTYLDKHASEIETLILGSSHTYYGVNPELFTSKTFNASYISQSYEYDLAIFDKYLTHFKNLKNVIIPISYFSMYGKLEEGSEPWRVKNYVLYYDFNNWKSISAHSEVLNHTFKSNAKRINSFYIDNISPITCTTFGWGFREPSLKQKDLFETGKIGALRHTQANLNNEKSICILEENQIILENFVAECSARNIKIIFVTLPAFKTYREHLNKKQLDINVQAGKKLAKGSKNVIYLNFLSDTRFNANDFQDADHLSAVGAAKFSTILNSIIVNP